MITRDESKIISSNVRAGYKIFPLVVDRSPIKWNERHIVVIAIDTPNGLKRGTKRYSQQPSDLNKLTDDIIKLHKIIYERRKKQMK